MGGNKFIIFIVIIIIISIPGVSHGDSIVIDPQMPHGEMITYSVTREDETYTLVTRTVHIKENGRELYEITSLSKSEDTIIKIDRNTMTVIYSKNISKKDDFSVERMTTILRDEIPRHEEEMIMIDFTGFDQLFRGFPFKNRDSLTIRSAGSDDFTMELTKKKKEEIITTKLGDIPCFKLELKMTGFWGTFLPKTQFWYSVEAPHYLVKYKGQEGPPGSPKISIEVIGYKGEQK